MTPNELKTRVTWATCVPTLALSSVAAWLAGAAVAWGVLAGGALAVLNFRWLVAHASLVTTWSAASGAWSIIAGVRFLVFLVIAGTLIATGAMHPVGFLAGLTVLPCAVVAQGLRAAREEP